MSLEINYQSKYFKRIYDLEKLLQPGKVLVLYGPRQVGKTTLIEELAKKTKLKTFKSTGEDIKLKILFETPDFDGLINFAKNYELIIIDEAQNIPNIGLGLKIIVDHIKKIKVVVSGSASFELAGQVGEPLVGRKRTYNLFPLSVLELKDYYSFYDFKNNLLKEMLLFGMYPEVLKASTDEEKRKILSEIVDSYLLKDIFALEKVRSPKILTNLLKMLAWQIGGEVSLTELSNNLNIDYKTVERYLDLLEKSFIIISLYGFSRNLRKELTKKNKYYFVDVGIRNALIGNFNEIEIRNDIGQLWENFILMERIKKLAYTKKYGNIYFWRTWDKKEVDLVEERDGKLYGYEFKWNTRKKIKAPKLWLDTYNNAEWQLITPENYLEFVV